MKEMIIVLRKKRRTHQPLFIRELEVERLSSIKYLGVHISEDLTFKTTQLNKKAQQPLYFLRRLRKFGMLPKILSKFYSYTVLSILTSCSTVWYGCTTVMDRSAASILKDPQPPPTLTVYTPNLRLKVLMSLKLEVEGVMFNVVSGYAPQVGCELEEKEKFWSELDEVMQSIPRGRRVLGVSSGKRKADKETWWWNEEVQECIQRKRLAKKKWDTERTEESRQEYREIQRKVKIEVAKAKQRAYEDLYVRLGTKEGEVDLYRVPREELWYCMRTSGVAEKYVRVVQDMYESCKTVVRCAVGVTEEFKVEVGLHQGSALSPFLFALVMDRLTDEVRQESPWTMMFADDIVICSESREQVEENLERWRSALENRGMKLSRSKTEYMCVNERDPGGMVRLQGAEVKKVQDFKYLGSTVQSNGECGKEVKRRVQAGWNGWRKVSGVLCDKRVSARMKGKVFKTVVRPAMLFGLETVALKKRQEAELEVAELKMLRFSLGVTRMDRIRNEYIRGTAHVRCFGDKVREARLRWF
ncbi:hypothetical protein Q8A73_002290 [Channa argus]|nr:hypothetical protein Q8A73_002290 [Channa argus]